MSGQTSQVWEAIHDGTQQRVAIKMLLGDYRRVVEHVGYLKHEFEVGVKLKHPQVIQIMELGTHDRSPYLVMELFPFPNLKQYITRDVGRLQYFVPKIVDQAAQGLAYLNQQGWIHRDIKPDNYLLNYEGDVKLIDFALAWKIRTGVAKMFGGKPKIQGTRSYMSPEQIRGQALDQRTDVYSFACFVFELIHGKPPFTAPSANELLNKHLRASPPRLDAMQKNVTAEFADLLKSMMAKEPRNRPASMDDFLRDFKRLRVFKITPKMPAQ